MQEGSTTIHHQGLIQTLMTNDTVEPNHRSIMFMDHLSEARIQKAMFSMSTHAIHFQISAENMASTHRASNRSMMMSLNQQGFMKDQLEHRQKTLTR